MATYWIFTKTKFRNLLTSRKGSAAIEFALLAIPFFALMFAIIEVAILFFVNSTMTHALTEAARQVRTGVHQTNTNCIDDGTAFKTLICEQMAGLGNCENDLRFDLVSPDGDRFDLAALAPAPPTPNPNGLPLDPDAVPESVYQDTGSGQVVIIRAQYFYRLALPGTLTFLANSPNNVHLLQTTTAFRNEPFPSTC